MTDHPPSNKEGYVNLEVIPNLTTTSKLQTELGVVPPNTHSASKNHIGEMLDRDEKHLENMREECFKRFSDHDALQKASEMVFVKCKAFYLV